MEHIFILIMRNFPFTSTKKPLFYSPALENKNNLYFQRFWLLSIPLLLKKGLFKISQSLQMPICNCVFAYYNLPHFPPLWRKRHKRLSESGILNCQTIFCTIGLEVMLKKQIASRRLLGRNNKRQRLHSFFKMWSSALDIASGIKRMSFDSTWSLKRNWFRKRSNLYLVSMSFQFNCILYF